MTHQLAYDVWDAFDGFEAFDLMLLIGGLALLLTAFLPRVMHDEPLTLPMSFVAIGYLAFALPLGFDTPDPIEHGPIVERLTEFGVIISLMVVGLTIDRPPGFKRWASTWRLLGITMPLTIAAAALLGWWVAGLVPATAMLFGAVVAPTDPVMGKDIELGAPGEGSEDAETEEHDLTEAGEEDELRFALTSEAGLNDGLAFPYTNMAIAMALAGAAPGNWFEAWLVVDVAFKLILALVLGLAVGKALGVGLLRVPAETDIAKTMTGIGALAGTFVIYGATEYFGGYGFIAVFIGAATIRHQSRYHEYHEYLQSFVEMAERLLLAAVMLLLGGAIARGLFGVLTWELILLAVLMVFVVRPLCGAIGLLGFRRAAWWDRAAISFFGIRGIATFYYLAYALNSAEFGMKEEIWALAALVVLISVVVHGLSGAPILQRLDQKREREPEGAQRA